jgi:hypothetical protein
MANILRDFCCTVHAELNSSSEDVVPPSPPPTTSSLKLISSGRATNSVPLPQLPPLQPEISLTPVTPKKRKGKENLKKNKKSKVSFVGEEEEEIACSEVTIEFIIFFIKNVEILIVTIFFSKIQ